MNKKLTPENLLYFFIWTMLFVIMLYLIETKGNYGYAVGIWTSWTGYKLFLEKE